MKLDWITDPHLDHMKGAPALIKFVDKLHHRDSDGLIITGDIGESRTIYEFMGILSGAYQRPIYFVLGNHDYYGNWMKQTRDRVRAVCKSCPPGILNWMSDLTEPLMVSQDTAIIGHDGFYDGQCGLGAGSDLGMSDFRMGNGIFDLAEALAFGSSHLFDRLLSLAQTSADHLEKTIRKHVRQPIKRVLIITHVPPFHEASYFRGRPSNARSAPYYVNKTMGDMLRRVTAEYPDIAFDVYAGHTHGKKHYQAEDNLNVYVGSARYEQQPQFQTPIEI
jgi:predicted phosphohydrolase